MEIKQMVKVELTEKERDTLIQAQTILKEVCLNCQCAACPFQRVCERCEMEPHEVLLGALVELNK